MVSDVTVTADNKRIHAIRNTILARVAAAPGVIRAANACVKGPAVEPSASASYLPPATIIRKRKMPILLWLLGIPIPIIIFLLLLWH